MFPARDYEIGGSRAGTNLPSGVAFHDGAGAAHQRKSRPPTCVHCRGSIGGRTRKERYMATCQQQETIDCITPIVANTYPNMASGIAIAVVVVLVVGGAALAVVGWEADR